MKSSACVQELLNDRDFSSLLSLLKVNRYGIREVTSKHLLDKEELEWIKEGTGITEVDELFEDRSGETIWFKDSRGFLYGWCRMGYELRLVGHSVEEGLNNLSDHPENILIWNDVEWLSKEDLKSRVAMMRELNMMYERGEMSEMLSEEEEETAKGRSKKQEETAKRGSKEQEERAKRRSKKSRKDGRNRRNKHRKHVK